VTEQRTEVATGCVTSVLGHFGLRTEVTEDRTDQGPRWM